MKEPEHRAQYVGCADHCGCMLFSPSGFDDELVEYAEENHVLLMGPDELLGKGPAPEIRYV